MKFSIKDKDWIVINENNIDLVKELDKKIHLIKMDFNNPIEDDIEEVLDRFPSTNRFIIKDNIKFYNDILRARKKYYIENKPGQGLISHFKKNNKVLLNYVILTDEEKIFCIENIKDILRNVEVLYLGENYNEFKNKLKNKNNLNELKSWNGNILIKE